MPDREEKTHRAILKQGFLEKTHHVFAGYVFRQSTAVGFAVILMGVALFTRSVRATFIAAAGCGLGVGTLYVVWFAVVYFFAYVWTRIVRWMKKAGP